MIDAKIVTHWLDVTSQAHVYSKVNDSGDIRSCTMLNRSAQQQCRHLCHSERICFTATASTFHWQQKQTRTRSTLFSFFLSFFLFLSLSWAARYSTYSRRKGKKLDDGRPTKSKNNSRFSSSTCRQSSVAFGKNSSVEQSNTILSVSSKSDGQSSADYFWSEHLCCSAVQTRIPSQRIHRCEQGRPSCIQFTVELDLLCSNRRLLIRHRVGSIPLWISSIGSMRLTKQWRIKLKRSRRENETPESSRPFIGQWNKRGTQIVGWAEQSISSVMIDHARRLQPLRVHQHRPDHHQSSFSETCVGISPGSLPMIWSNYHRCFFSLSCHQSWLWASEGVRWETSSTASTETGTVRW